MIQILKAIWESQPHPYVSIPRRQGKDWIEGKLLSKSDALTALATIDYSDTDAYWCPHTFKDANKGRTKGNVTDKLSFLWADLDKVHPSKVDITPSIAWSSSDNSYQAIWLLDSEYDKYEVEKINKAYTYHIGADKSGWDLTQLLRIPNTINYKYNPPQQGKLLWVQDELYELKDFIVVESPEEISTQLVLPKRAKELLSAKTTEGEDRSERLWELEKLLIEAEIPIVEVVGLVKDTVWNKFKDRPNGDSQLLAETLKAENEFKKAKKLKENTTPKLDLADYDSFKDFMYKDLGLPEFAIKGVWQDKSVGIMAGEPKTMKSMLAIDMGLSLCTGSNFLGSCLTRRGGALYIQEEINTADVKNRVSKQAKAKGITDLDLNCIPDLPFTVMNNKGFDLTTDEHKKNIEYLVDTLDIKLLILDPMYMMLGDKDENSATDMRPVLQWLTSLREKYECSVLVIHHFKKTDSKRSGQRMRGSSILHAWVECGLYLEIDKTIGNIRMDREFRSFKSDGSLLIEFSGVDNTYDMTVSEKESGSKI